MKLIVTGPTPVEAPPVDAYTVEIEMVMGDADGYSQMTMRPFKRGVHEENLKSLLEVLERVAAAYPWGKGGDDNYDHIPGFVQWFGDIAEEYFEESYPEAHSSTTPEEQAKFFALSEQDGLYKEWPLDPTIDYQGPQSLKRYKVFYYDANSVKHDVEVDWEN